MILYYTDVPPDLGPTMLVSQEHTKDLPLWPPFKTRKKHPELYRLERPVLATAGTLLLFSMRTFHRASQMTAVHGLRLSHHMVWRAVHLHFQGYHLWPAHGEDENLQRFIARASPAQRQVLGFPCPEDPYW